MKKIISGKLYDTDTAKYITCYANEGNWRDSFHFEETLYRKRTGEYFLHCDGGPMTRYAERVNTNNWSGGTAIIPMTYESAAQWAKEHMSADEYQAEFGEVSESTEEIAVGWTIPAHLADKLDKTAARRGVSKRQIIVELLETL